MTYKYTISSGGALTGKTLFASVGSDGDGDRHGGQRLHVRRHADNEVLVYNSAGTQIAAIATPRAAHEPLLRQRRQADALHHHAARPVLDLADRAGRHDRRLADDLRPRRGRSPIRRPRTTDWVTSSVTDDGTVASVKLSYTVGGTGLPTNVFTETMASTPTASGSSWTGTGANNAWTVTEPSGENYVTQATAANYGSGNACGLQFKGGDSTLADTMVATTNGINVGRHRRHGAVLSPSAQRLDLRRLDLPDQLRQRLGHLPERNRQQARLAGLQLHADQRPTGQQHADAVPVRRATAAPTPSAWTTSP